MRFPLYIKILLWFFVNVLILAIGAWWASGGHFPPELDSFVGGHAGDRVQREVNILSVALHSSPRDQWGTVLKSLETEYPVHCYLFENGEGRQLAGEKIELPKEVHARLVERPNNGQGRFDGPPGDGPPNNRPSDGSNPPPVEGGRPPADQNPPPPEDGNRPPPPLRQPPGGERTRFMLHAGQPSLYWVLVRIPPLRPADSRPIPASIIITSETLSAGGLFFDAKPWLEFGAAALLVSALLWFPFVHGITRSIGRMTRATEQIAAGNFDARAAEKRSDELGSLSGAINTMAARLSGFVGGQKRFLGDIAHELCSPLARAQMALGIMEERGDDTMKSYVADVREEIELMSSLVNELLSFSKASLGSQIKLQPTLLLPLVEKAAQRESDRDAAVEIDGPGNLTVMAEPELLLRSLSNLIRNAIHYAGHAGSITITAAPRGDKIDLTVSDNGPGVPAEALAQVFDPFYRVDPSRARETGGVGLGLAIVKTCVESCGGTVTARNRQPSGLEVIITLQKAP